MSRKVYILIFLFLLVAGQGYAREQYVLETIDKVIRADIYELKSGKKIRLIGLESPEDFPGRKAREQAERWGKTEDEILRMGEEATAWIETRLQDKDIFVKYDKKKDDGRGYDWVYAFLYDENKFYGGITVRMTFDDVFFEWNEPYERGRFIFLNATIVKGGYATPVRRPPNTKWMDWIEEGYIHAQEEGEGLFNVDYFEMPCEEEGSKIGECAGCIQRCCKPAIPVFDLKVNGKCGKMPAAGASGYCSYCGNNVCDKDYMEDACNCPMDCK